MATNTTENDNASRFPDAELKARAAWHYYVEGLTQERISEMLGIGRIKVHRILSAARDEGVVQFRIRDSVVECVHAGAAAQGSASAWPRRWWCRPPPTAATRRC